jgi:hypothetical protein
VSCPKRLIAGLSTQKYRFDPGPFNVGLKVVKVALGQVFFRVLQFPRQYITPMFHVHSFIYSRSSTNLARHTSKIKTLNTKKTMAWGSFIQILQFTPLYLPFFVSCIIPPPKAWEWQKHQNDFCELEGASKSVCRIKIWVLGIAGFLLNWFWLPAQHRT